MSNCGVRGLAAGMRMRAAARPLAETMLQELDTRREDTATVRLLWDDRTQIVWLHVQEDGGAEHVVGVPALEARDAFLCPSLYVGFERALAAAGSGALDRA
jgi:hypothetical protein